MKSTVHRIFEKEFSLQPGHSRQFTGKSAGFTDDIDTYHVAVAVADDDSDDDNDWSRVDAIERGAANFEAMNEEEYESYEFYACDGAAQEVSGIVCTTGGDDAANSAAGREVECPPPPETPTPYESPTPSSSLEES